jgi:hypothetical protein
LNLFGLSSVEWRHGYDIVAVCLEQNKIFLVYGPDKVLMSYEMDSGKVQFIHELGRGTQESYIPYAPLYTAMASDSKDMTMQPNPADKLTEYSLVERRF